MNQGQGNDNGHRNGNLHVFTYFVDDESQTTSEHQLTAVQIMVNSGIDASTHYLVWVHGNAQTSYQENPESMVQIHENMKFISVYTGETQVS